MTTILSKSSSWLIKGQPPIKIIQEPQLNLSVKTISLENLKEKAITKHQEDVEINISKHENLELQGQ